MTIAVAVEARRDRGFAARAQLRDADIAAGWPAP
jgi:hypothetical protein